MIDHDLTHLLKIVSAKRAMGAVRGNPILPRSYWKRRVEALAQTDGLLEYQMTAINKLRSILADLDERFPE